MGRIGADRRGSREIRPLRMRFNAPELPDPTSRPAQKGGPFHLPGLTAIIHGPDGTGIGSALFRLEAGVLPDD